MATIKGIVDYENEERFQRLIKASKVVSRQGESKKTEFGLLVSLEIDACPEEIVEAIEELKDLKSSAGEYRCTTCGGKFLNNLPKDSQALRQRLLEVADKFIDHACFTKSVCGEPLCQEFHAMADFNLQPEALPLECSCGASIEPSK